MLKSMLKTVLFSHAKKMRDRQPCRLNIGKHLCCSNQPPPPPEEKKDLFLYLEMGQKLCRLNIRELCERWSHLKKPQFEVVQVFNPNEYFSKHYMIVGNSKLYMMGRIDQNLDVYSFDPTESDDNGLSFHLCEKNETHSYEVFTLGEKIYVVDSRDRYARSFKVFDPLHESWRLLPEPPSCYSIYGSHTWGHKHFVCGYVFDARQEKWEPTDKKECLNEWFKAVVEFQGFLIGVYRHKYQRKHSYQIVANYQMESNWDREPDQVLHELQGPMPSNCQFFLGKCDSDRMWLVCSGLDGMNSAYTCVTVFRVSISYDIAGNPVISANVEASSEIIDAHRDAKSIVSSASALCHHLNTMPQKRDWFLYLNMNKRLCRVNITEFCERSSPKPKFEVVHSFPEEGHPSPIPRRMRHVTVGSKSYMVGGERLDGSLHCDANGRCFPSPNLDIFSFDPTHTNGPLITICNGDIPRLIDPKTKTIPIVTTIEEKIYVLAKRPYLGEAEELDDDQAPKFKVFDPLHRSWKHLPDPPCYDKSLHDTELFVYNHFAWGHKLIISTKSGSYIFDTHQEKWEDTTHQLPNEGFKAAVEVGRFLIGMPYNGKDLVAYQLDSNGVFKPYKVLHELQGIFRTCLLVCDYSMGKCDADRIWLVYSGKDGLDLWKTWVVVLRVLTSIDNVGNSVLSVAIEAEECLHSNWCRLQISSAFSLCHHLKKNLDIEGKTW